jgi:hypothetical protein
MDVKMICYFCGGTATTMLVRHRKVVCLDCMTKQYPGHVANLVHYLTTIKNIGTGGSPGKEGLSSSYNLNVRPQPGELVASMSPQN